MQSLINLCDVAIATKGRHGLVFLNFLVSCLKIGACRKDPDSLHDDPALFRHVMKYLWCNNIGLGPVLPFCSVPCSRDNFGGGSHALPHLVGCPQISFGRMDTGQSR